MLPLCSQNQVWLTTAEAFLLIAADSLQGEEEDPQDLCVLRNLNKNTLAGASSHLQWSRVGRPGLRVLH